MKRTTTRTEVKLARISIRVMLVALVPLLLGACSSSPKLYKVEYYQPAYRQTPPDPVYSRVIWSHLPSPVRPKTPDTAPLMMPELFVELKNVTVDEAIEAVAQTMGYRWEERSGLPNTRISIHKEGTLDEILGDIRSKTGVALTLDHDRRLIRIAKRITSPRLPVKSRYRP